MSKAVDRRTLNLDMQDASPGESFVYFTGTTREFGILRTEDGLKDFIFRRIRSGWWIPVQRLITVTECDSRVFEYMLVKRRYRTDKWLRALMLAGYIKPDYSASNIHSLYPSV